MFMHLNMKMKLCNKKESGIKYIRHESQVFLATFSRNMLNQGIPHIMETYLGNVILGRGQLNWINIWASISPSRTASRPGLALAHVDARLF